VGAHAPTPIPPGHVNLRHPRECGLWDRAGSMGANEAFRPTQRTKILATTDTFLDSNSKCKLLKWFLAGAPPPTPRGNLQCSLRPPLATYFVGRLSVGGMIANYGITQTRHSQPPNITQNFKGW